MTDINKLRHRCFFDIAIGQKNVGRIVFELFNDICPKTCDNFRSLCTGEKGIGKTTGKPLHYKNAIFHRVVKNFIIQSGDFSTGNGRGGESIYGGTFPDENFVVKHEKPFLLSMANRGQNTNGSQFFITLSQAPHLDGVHVVFGHVLSGQEVIKEIENQSTDKNGKPLLDVLISNCGELIPQIKTKDKKKKHKREKSRKSDGELTSDEENKESGKDKKKSKKHKKHKKEKEENKDDDAKSDKELEDIDLECSVRPEEVPDIPDNKFLMRDSDKNERDRNFRRMTDDRRDVSRSGRKFKGRGVKRFRTPSPEDRYRSGSETPPHWKAEQRKTLNWKDIVSGKRRDNESRDSYRYERRSGFPRNDYRNRYQSYSNHPINATQRDNYERKRVFREEPPNRTDLPQSVSPHRSSNLGDQEDKRNNGISFVSQSEQSPEIQRHSVRSEVKLKKREDSSEENNYKQLDNNQLDIKDIPLPDTKDDQRISDEIDERNRKERSANHSNHRRHESDDKNSKRTSRRRHSSNS